MTRPDVEQQALAWAARHDRGRLDAAEAKALDAWLAADPSHRAAFDGINDLWSLAGEVAHEIGPAEPPLAAPANDRGWYHKRFAAAAAVLLMAGAAALGLHLMGDPSYETAVGEQRVVTLADGSRVTLNTDTEITADFTDKRRTIALARGEALFEVAHDAARPFVVESPLGSVRAVGTKFVVRIEAEKQLAVLVTEGKVLVARPESPATPLEAGAELRAAGESLAVKAVPAERIQQDLAWRVGNIYFNGEPLAEAAAQMQRYAETRIAVDPRVAHYHVGGHFRTNGLDEFLATVQAAFPVKVVKSSAEIRIEPLSPSDA